MSYKFTVWLVCGAVSLPIAWEIDYLQLERLTCLMTPRAVSYLRVFVK
jgi:hypothetical protein